MPLPNLGQLPPPSSAHPGLYQRPHWGGSWHRTLACPQGSGPRPLFLSLPFLLGKPTLIYPGLKARTFASAPPVYMAPHPSPSVLHPCRRRPITKTLTGPRQEYRTGLRFGVMVAQPCVPRQNCPMFITPLGSLHLTFLVRSHLAAIASSQDPLPA